jgi:alpha-N-arabinofuranosidase
MLTRRRFLQNSAAAFFLIRNASAFPAADSSIDSRIEILLDEPLGTISPDIYGHFTEHLGGVIYDGIWVGRNSRVPQR